jgi:thiol-disulfide isomerase/thioredoxin/predicted RNA-binding Zn-ribbon protein involved in translation (DUF1610 family)
MDDAEPTTDLQTCPKCGYEIPEARRGSQDCPQCGVVFARFDPSRVRMAPMARVAHPDSKKPPVLLIGLALATVLVMVLGWPRPGIEPPEPDRPTPVAEAVEPGATGSITEPDPAQGLTADDLRARPGLQDWGEIDPDRPPTRLTPTQLSEAREATDPLLSLDIAPLDPTSTEGMSALDARPTDGSSAKDDELAWVGWYEGADGYSQAQRQLEQMSPRPLVVYFHADWCAYCKRFERDFLPDPLLRRFLSDVLRVHVNPEASPQDKALADRFGVRGYPSFFILRPGEQPGQAHRVHPFWDKQAIPVTDFVAMAEEAAGGR